ncbi:hypothetical protein E2C01_069413 [Portunus trituberculatus]|uniref:Uncharacterized protein n=1 Tax=Portunus trituberculatus TaxID=210409 RepID=A0A5B7HRI4_PORTR|nr:hypothetical protein [Portunus trituberculatus]
MSQKERFQDAAPIVGSKQQSTAEHSTAMYGHWRGDARKSSTTPQQNVSPPSPVQPMGQVRIAGGMR